MKYRNLLFQIKNDLETYFSVPSANSNSNVIKNILFVDTQSVNDYDEMVGYVNNETLAILYNSESTTRKELKTVLNHLTKFDFANTKITDTTVFNTITVKFNRSCKFKVVRFGFVFSTDPDFNNVRFLEGRPYNDTENVQWLLNVVQKYRIQTIDFFGCNTLLDSEWKKYYDYLMRKTSASIYANAQLTGNQCYGGSWQLEKYGNRTKSSNVNTEYFTSDISNYSHLLDFYGVNTGSLIDNSGNLWAWGRNGNGQIGFDTGPNDVIYVTNISSISVLSGKIVNSIGGATQTTYVGTTEGRFYATGINTTAGLLLNENATTPVKFYSECTRVKTILGNNVSLVKVFKNQTGSNGASTFMTYDASLSRYDIYSIGPTNSNGQFGDGNVTSTIANPVIASSFKKMTNDTGDTPVNVKTTGTTMFVLMNSGILYGCGSSTLLGYGTTGANITKIRNLMTGFLVGKTVKQVVCSSSHVLVLTNDNLIYGCGVNNGGALGLGNSNITSPITSWTAMDLSPITSTGRIPAVISVGSNFSFVLCKDGVVYGCGGNANGQLGTGNTNSPGANLAICLNSFQSEPPTKVITAIQCFSASTTILTVDGRVYSCGSNTAGILGGNLTNGINSSTLRPLRTSSDVDITNVKTLNVDYTPIVPEVAPTAPTITSIIASTDGTSQTISFTAPANTNQISGYSYSTDGTTYTNANTTTSPFTINVAPGTAVTIKAFNGAGTSVASDSITVATAPVITNIVAYTDRMDVYFTESTGGSPTLTGYMYSTNNGSSFSVMVGTSSPYTIPSLTSGSTFDVILKSYSSTWESAYSNTVTKQTYSSGTAPSLISITPGTNQLTVVFNESTGGVPSAKYYYSFDDGTNVLGTGVPSSPIVIDISIAGTYTVHVIARGIDDSTEVWSQKSTNSMTGTPYVIGTAPTIGTITPGLNKITVAFAQSTLGTSPTTYYYSFDGTTPEGTGVSASPLEISGISSATLFYVIASNVAGNITSLSATGTPYIVGSAPSIGSVIPGTNKLTVTFTGSTGGNPTPTYYYSYESDGSNRIGPVTSPFDISGTVARTVYIVASNLAGNVISTGESGTPYTFGSTPTVSLASGTNALTVTYSQATPGSATTTFFYSLNGGTLTSASASPFTLETLTSTTAYTLYIVARNPAGDISSNTVTGNVFGTAPTIGTITPGTNQLSVAFTQSSVGTATTTYYYSFDGTTPLGSGVSASPLVITGISSETVFYIIASNPAGNVVSTETGTGTPYILGSTPSIESVIPGTNKLTVTFTGSTGGNPTPTYYYSYASDGSNRVGPVTSPFDISGTVARTVYVIASNDAGNVISAGASGTPYIFGSTPTVSLASGTNALTVTYSQATPGSANTTFFYSLNGGTLASASASPFTIPSLTSTTAYTLYIVARNPAGDVSSNTVTGNVFGSTPTVSLASGTNALTVTYSQATPGTDTTTFFYSLNGGTLASASASPFTIPSLTSTTAYTLYIVARNPAGDVSSNTVNGNVFGTAPTIGTITPGTNQLSVAFTQSSVGTATTTYYYSFDGTTPLGSGVSASPLVITGISSETVFYIIASNPAGNVASTSATGTPYTIGSAPSIGSVIPGTNKLTVTFTGTTGNPTPTYYYSYESDGSNRVGPVTSPFDISSTVARTVYVIASNDAGNVISAGVSETPYTFGSTPTVSLASGTNELTVTYSQATPGSATTTFFYSLNGGTLTDASASPFIIPNLTSTTAYTLYIVARNPAGDVSSNTVTGNVFGTAPTIGTITPGTNQLSVAFTQSSVGTATTRYYYSLNGTTKLGSGTLTSPLVITDISSETVFYIIASNPAGDVVSTETGTGTPYTIGSAPSIGSVIPGTNNLTVTFTGTTGNPTPTYYYSFLSDGSSRVGPVTSPFDISGTVARTVYVIASNDAGNVISAGESGTPYIFGSTPTVSLASGTNELTVTYSQATPGSATTTFFYSLNGGTLTSASPSPFTIPSLTSTTAYTLYILARNPAGDISSNTVTGNVFGTAPTIGTITPGTNQLSVAFTQSSVGTATTTYYYSLNGTTKLGSGTLTSPLVITDISSQITFYIIASNPAGDVRSISNASGTPYILGSAPTIGTITPGTNQISVAFSQSSVGTSPTTYYYSIDGTSKEGSGRLVSPLVISGISSPITFYIIASNAAGDIRSTSTSTGTPNTLGSSPSIVSVVPGISKLTVTFNGTTGNPAPTYFYSFLSDGTSRVGPVTSPFDISGTVARTVYVVASNTAGNLVSTGVSGTPYIIGTKPVITSVASGVNGLTVYFTASTGGNPSSPTYYCSVDGSTNLITIGKDVSSVVISGLSDSSHIFVIIAKGLDPSSNVIWTSESISLGGPTYNINNSSLSAYFPCKNDIFNYTTGTGVAPYAFDVNVSHSTETSIFGPGNGAAYFGLSNSTGIRIVNPSTGITLGGSAGVSVALWAKYNSTTIPGTQRLFEFTLATHNNISFSYFSLAYGSNAFLNASFTNAGVVTSYLLSDTNWHHYCVTISSSGSWVVYVDGVSVGSQSSITGWTSKTFTDCLIGGTNFPVYSSGARGVYIDQFVCFARTLTVNEVTYFKNYPASIILSSSPTSPPNLLGVAPVISPIVPGANKLTVTFSSTGGYPIPTYSYSYASDGSNPIGPVTSPFDISGSVTRTVYIVATNIMGTLISAGVSGTPYTFGSKPTVSLASGTNALTVTYSQDTSGTSPTTFLYSLNGGILKDASASPFTLNSLTSTTAYTLYIVARNPAGDISSNTITGNVFGTAPTIGTITPETNQLSVVFTQSSVGTATTRYYYSIDGTSKEGSGTLVSPLVISGISSQITFYIIASNPAGDVRSILNASGTPNTIGPPPSIDSVIPGTNKLTVTFTGTTGNPTPTYFYSFLSNGTSRVGPVTSPFDIAGTVARTVYVVASNLAGNVVSTGTSGTPYIFGSAPTIGTITPGTNQLSVAFTQSSLGTSPTTYYYSLDGTTKLGNGTQTSPLVITDISLATTFYIIASNAAGDIRSVSTATGTPNTLGPAPTIGSVIPGTNKLTVTFTGTTGNPTPTYFYSFLSDGTSRVGPVTSPFDISSTVARTVYVVASNLAGNVVSTGTFGTPYIFGSTPTVSLASGTNALTVTYSQATPGTATTSFFYSLNGGTLTSASASPFTLETLTSTTAYTLYILARNPAGDISSNTVTGNVFGTAPTIGTVTPGTNQLSVAFAQSSVGTATTRYYYSLNGTTTLGSGTLTSPLVITGISSETVFYIIASNPAGNVRSILNASGTPYILGSAPTIGTVTPGTNQLSVAFSQSSLGTSPTTYYYSINGISKDGSGTLVSPLVITDISSAITFYIIASNVAGDIRSVSSASGTPYVLGSIPSIVSVVGGTNKLTVTFNASTGGNPTPTYYYSYASDGSNRVGPVTSPFDILNITVAKTVYIVASNSAGDLISTGVSGTPNTLGTTPVITNITSGTSKLTVTFNASTGGNPTPTYYYSYASDGSNRVGPVTSPFDILNITVAKTVYIVASNSVGNVVSTGASGTPYVIGSAPVINTITPAKNSLVVDFTGSIGGYPSPTTYLYSLDDGDYVNANTTSSPITIGNLTIIKQYSVKIIAQNAGGNTSASNTLSGTPIADSGGDVPITPATFWKQQYWSKTTFWKRTYWGRRNR